MATPKSDYRRAVAEKCKGCIYDSYQPGNWREQVACCASPNCPLFAIRPVPRKCMAGGEHDLAAIAELRADMDERQRRFSRRLSRSAA